MKKSSSSSPTVQSPTPKDVLALGRALVEELGLDPGVDTLSRWIAHYIAELMVDAEFAMGEERTAKQAKCADTILDLWGRRGQLPNGKRPFEDLEPILRALESLDPADETPRYFHATRMLVDEEEQDTEAKKWLKLASGLDNTAKVLIGFCLTQASQAAIDKSQKWVSLAEKAGAESAVESPLIRFIIAESNLAESSDPDDKLRKQLEDRINKLTAFTSMANDVLSSMRHQLIDATETTKDKLG